MRPQTVAEATPNGPEQDREQSLIEHLTELRSRLLRAVVAVLAGFVLLIPVAGRLYGWLADPLASRLPEGAQLVAIEVVSPFLTPIVGVFHRPFLTMPVVLYQLRALSPPPYQRATSGGRCWSPARAVLRRLRSPTSWSCRWCSPSGRHPAGRDDDDRHQSVPGFPDHVFAWAQLPGRWPPSWWWPVADEPQRLATCAPT